jgi:hypothetical protein
MSKHSCTAYFSDPLSGAEVTTHLNLAAELLGARASLRVARDRYVAANDAGWSLIVGSFSKHDYTGEVRWRISDGSVSLDGAVTFPIAPPVPMPGTVEFDFSWSEAGGKSRGLAFADLDRLLAFLLKVANAVGADGLVVEPKKLPPAVADQRYARFRAMARSRTLSSVDWITGLRRSDPQYPCLERAGAYVFRQVVEDGFVMAAFSGQPFDLGRNDDLKTLAQIELAFFG